MAGNTVYVQGNYVDVHDNEVVNLSIDKVGTLKVADEAELGKLTGNVSEQEIPSCLTTPEAEVLWERLRTSGFIVRGGYGLAETVSANQATYIADRMAVRLEITQSKWKIFHQPWGIKNMAQLAGSWQQTGKLPPKAKELELLM